MNEDITRKHAGRSSPRAIARATGVFFFLTLALGVFAQAFISDRLIVWGNAAVTAENITTHRGLYTSGLTAYLVEMVCNVTMTALFYVLLKPAGPSLSLVALCIGLVGCTIKTVARAFYAAPLFLLGKHAFHALTPDAVNELSLALLVVNNRAAGIALSFFGFNTLLVGWLMLKSTFLPRVLGVLGIVCGLGWLTFLWPPLGARVFMVLALFALLASLATIFWMLVFGVNEPKWFERERASAG